VTVADAPFVVMLVTEELLLFHVTVRPLIVAPADDLAVAVRVTDSVGLTIADDRLIVTVATVAGGGLVVPPSLPPLPPHPTTADIPTARTSFATRI
jgi:hypothetical protein